MRRFIIIFLASILGGCTLFLPNIVNQGNSVVVNYPYINIEIDENYSYLGGYEFSERRQYSDHPDTFYSYGDSLVFYNQKDKSFASLLRQTCNRCKFDTPSTSNSIKIGGYVFNKNENSLKLSANNESDSKLLDLMQSTDDSITSETIFNYKDYSHGSGYEHFRLLVMYYDDELSAEIDNIVKISAN